MRLWAVLESHLRELRWTGQGPDSRETSLQEESEQGPGGRATQNTGDWPGLGRGAGPPSWAQRPLGLQGALARLALHTTHLPVHLLRACPSCAVGTDRPAPMLPSSPGALLPCTHHC